MTETGPVDQGAVNVSPAAASPSSVNRSGVAPFDVLAPLPQPGEPPLLLEASAGTGKTWAIGALVARYVAQGRLLDSILVITFGRAASRELRERVRWHLRGVLAGLEDAADPDWGQDQVVTALRDGTPEEIALRMARLRAALTEFDAATIATTHQFCQIVLRSLGVAGDSDPDARLVEDLSDLREEVVDDLYVRGFAREDAQPAFTRQEAGDIARQVVEDPHAALSPDLDDLGLSGGGTRFGPVPEDDVRKLRFARAVRDEMTRRKRRLGVLSFDDLLGDLAQALDQDDSPAAARMIGRWQVVLVDEFQDTDPVQWRILRRAFARKAALILIGDPKQAIYGFRGGDVDTYLQAADEAGSLSTLGRNHRTDARLVEALGALLHGVELGSERIVVRPVEAACPPRLDGPGGHAPPPHRLRFVPTGLLRPAGSTAGVGIDSFRALVAQDCAAEIGALLRRGLTFEGRAVRPGDIAVLAQTRRQLECVRAALRDAGIPSIIAAEESVFATRAATDWLTLLEALARPQRPDRAKAAALTPFLGYDAAQVAALDDAGDDALAHRLHDWAGLLERRGVAAVQAAATAGGMDAAVLRHTGGDRHLTDVRHLGELLHQRGLAEGDGLAGLIRWLRERMAATREGERTRRLESDADAVRLSTIHKSKGLQYPIVLLPFVADRWRSAPDVLRFHDDAGRRCLDIGITGDPGRAARAAAHQREEDGESLRLLYVALTRAQSHLVTWWFGSGKNTAPASLHRLLFGRSPTSPAGAVPVTVAVPAEAQARRVLAEWAAQGAFALEEVGAPTPQPVVLPSTPVALAARPWSRRIDTGWRRTSYTGLSRPLEEARYAGGLVGSEPDTGSREGEDVVPLEGSEELAEVDAVDAALSVAGAAATGVPPELAEAHKLPSQPVPMGTLPVGANFGSLVHEVLELVDPGSHDLSAAFREQVDARCARWGLPGIDRNTLTDALVAVCDTPLGPLLPGVTLRRIGRDRLCEMAFDLPLAGGDAAHEGDGALLGALAGLLREHLPEGDPVRALADALDDPLLGDQPLRGYLTGSVDVVLRHEGRYVVVDYKTNWLGPPGEPLTTAHYGPAQLRAAMGHSSYPLQALLYAVVLHRFLRWRLPGYDPAVHLSGVLYLYVRGMIGAETPVIDGQPSGVFSWSAPPALVEAVSALLDGRAP